MDRIVGVSSCRICFFGYTMKSITWGYIYNVDV